MAYGIIPIFVPHEGCPNDCVFCNQRRIACEKSPTACDVKNIIDEAIKVRAGMEVAFYGGSFTGIEAERQIELLEAVKPYIECGSVEKIRISTRPDYIDRVILERLREYGVETIELGAQSMCDDVLLASQRGHTSDDIRRASKLISEYGFKLGLQVMTGLPLDNAEKSLYTAHEAAKLSPDCVRIYPVVVIRDTALYDMWVNGEYTALTVEEAADRAGDMFEVFLHKNINVIRIGLNPTKALSDGGAAAGGYHPALGEMARSRVYRKRASQLLEKACFAECDAVFMVSRDGISLMSGVGRENILYLTEKYQNICKFKNIKIKTNDTLKRYDVELL